MKLWTYKWVRGEGWVHEGRFLVPICCSILPHALLFRGLRFVRKRRNERNVGSCLNTGWRQTFCLLKHLQYLHTVQYVLYLFKEIYKHFIVGSIKGKSTLLRNKKKALSCTKFKAIFKWLCAVIMYVDCRHPVKMYLVRMYSIPIVYWEVSTPLSLSLTLEYFCRPRGACDVLSCSSDPIRFRVACQRGRRRSNGGWDTIGRGHGRESLHPSPRREGESQAV